MVSSRNFLRYLQRKTFGKSPDLLLARKFRHISEFYLVIFDINQYFHFIQLSKLKKKVEFSRQNSNSKYSKKNIFNVKNRYFIFKSVFEFSCQKQDCNQFLIEFLRENWNIWITWSLRIRCKSCFKCSVWQGRFAALRTSLHTWSLLLMPPRAKKLTGFNKKD